MDTKTEKRIDDSFISSKTDELYYLTQVYKSLKYLEHMYLAGKLEDENKTWYTRIALSVIKRQRDKLIQEIGKDGLEEWRTFDQS
jgi:hypothetical protein